MSASLDFKAIRAEFKAHKKRKAAAGKTLATKRGEVLEARAMAYLKKVVAPQLESGLSLTLIDSYAAYVLKCTPREAKRTKDFLSSMGVIICPSRPKAPGKLTKWLVPYKFLLGVERPERKRRTRSSLKYLPAYYELRSKHWRSLKEWLAEERVEMEYSEQCMAVAINVKQELAYHGLTKEDFLRPPYTQEPTLVVPLPHLIVI